MKCNKQTFLLFVLLLWTGMQFAPTVQAWEFTPEAYTIEEELASISLPITALDDDDVEEGIIGLDDQQLVPDTSAHPYRQIVRLYLYFENYHAVGSGTMIGPDTVLTAAHNVYHDGKWAEKIVVAPAMSGPNDFSNGLYVSKEFYMFEGYKTATDDDRQQYDTAILKLPSAIDESIGYLNVSDSLSIGQHIQVGGYPSVSHHKKGYQYRMYGTVTDIDANVFHYEVDTEGGQSGGPVLDDQQNIVGVHVAGIGNGAGLYVKNEARLIKEDTKQMIDMVQHDRPLIAGVSSNVNQVPQPKLPTLTLRIHHVVVDAQDDSRVIENLPDTTHEVKPGWHINIPVVQEDGLFFWHGPRASIRISYDEVAALPQQEATFRYVRYGPAPKAKQEPQAPSVPDVPTPQPAPDDTNQSDSPQQNPPVPQAPDAPKSEPQPEPKDKEKPTPSPQSPQGSTPDVPQEMPPATPQEPKFPREEPIPPAPQPKEPSPQVPTVPKSTPKSEPKGRKTQPKSSPKAPKPAPKQPKPKVQPAPSVLKAVYRLRNAKTNEYFYTLHNSEREKLVSRGWKDEGCAWKSETTKGTPVYRLQNIKTKEYFYTKNSSEYEKLGKRGWKQEGIAFRSYGSVPVYRLHNAKTKKYFFTRHTSERDKLVRFGWTAEGLAFYTK